MRWYRVALASLPYAVILGALAAADLWYAFWVLAALTAFLYVGVFFLTRRFRRRQTSDEGPAMPTRGQISVDQYTAFLKRWWWAIALGGAGFATAGFLPDLRESGPWAILGFAATIFVAAAVGVRLSAKFLTWYEREFQRFSQCSRSRPRPTS